MVRKRIHPTKNSLADRLSFDDSIWDDIDLTNYVQAGISHQKKVKSLQPIVKIEEKKWIQGILYKIRCLPNNSEYIGQTTCTRLPSSVKTLPRIAGHLKDLKKGLHHKFAMQRDWNQYGEESFDISIVEIYDERMFCDIRSLKSFLDKREIELIFEVNSLYNSEIQFAKLHATSIKSGFSSRAELMESISLGEISVIRLVDEWVNLEDHYPNFVPSAKLLVPGVRV